MSDQTANRVAKIFEPMAPDDDEYPRQRNQPTLRDRFAMAIAAGLAASGGMHARVDQAYTMADAALAARTAPPEAEEGK